MNEREQDGATLTGPPQKAKGTHSYIITLSRGDITPWQNRERVHLLVESEPLIGINKTAIKGW
jgi:hypothetical protein